MRSCPSCGFKVEKRIVQESYLGHKLGSFEGWACANCGETILTEESATKAFEKVKSLGLTGLSEKTVVTKSGNSLALRLKKKLADFIGVSEGQEVLITPHGKNKLVIEVV